MAYLAGAVLTIPAFLVWRMPRRWWEALERTWWDRLKAMLQSIPAITLGAWLLFGVFFPIDTALGGNRPGRISLVEVVAIIACALPWATTLVGWPLWLLPPGARNEDDARYFTSHWAGIFGAGMLLGALFFAVHTWWPAVAGCLAAAGVLVLIQLTLLGRRSPTDR